jgi:hypothetical protein
MAVFDTRCYQCGKPTGGNKYCSRGCKQKSWRERKKRKEEDPKGASYVYLSDYARSMLADRIGNMPGARSANNYPHANVVKPERWRAILWGEVSKLYPHEIELLAESFDSLVWDAIGVNLSFEL